MSTAVASRVPTLENARAAAKACGEADKNVEEVLVFGSVARGNADAESDIDLLVLVSEDIDGHEPPLMFFFSKEARAAAGVHCDVIVRSSNEWEHLSTNVSSSFESFIKPETLSLFHREAPERSTRLDNLTRVSKDNMDEAAKHCMGARASLDKLCSAISWLYLKEGLPSWSTSDHESKLCIGRIQYILKQSYDVMEFSIRSIGASVGKAPLGAGHDLLKLVSQMRGEVPEVLDARETIDEILEPLRLLDGTIRNWHMELYAGEREDWVQASTNQNARTHIESALSLAQMAASELENRPSESTKPAEAAHWIRLLVSEIKKHPYVRLELDEPPPDST